MPLLAQVATHASDVAIRQMPWFGWIAIVAILGGSISGIFKMLIDHRERMAMIAQGMNPDASDETRKTSIGEL